MDRKIEKSKFPKRAILLGLGGILLLSSLVLSFKRAGGNKSMNVTADRLMLDTVQHGKFQEYIPVSAVVLPYRSVVIAAQEGGRIEQKLIEDGSLVQSGQMILQLSNPDVQLNYLNQEGNILNQINQLQNLQLLQEQQSLRLKELALDVDYQMEILGRKLTRDEQLLDAQAIARIEFEDGQSQYNSLQKRRALLLKNIEKDSLTALLQQSQMENSLDLMQRNLDIAKANLASLEVKVPIQGQLSGLSVEVGELLPKGAPIAQIDDLSNFKIRANVDEYYISRVFPEQEGSFVYAGQRYQLKISKIYPEVNEGSFVVDLAFVDQIPEGIKRGQTVSVRLELSSEERAVLVKKGAFYQSTGGNWIYVLSANGQKAVKRSIQLGRSNPKFFEVKEGLELGEVVVTSSYQSFGEQEELIFQD